MKSDTTEQLASVRAELTAHNARLTTLQQKITAADESAADTAGLDEIATLQANRSQLLGELYQAGKDPANDKGLAEIDRKIADAEAKSKGTRDRAEGARIVADQLRKQYQAEQPAVAELHNKLKTLSLAVMREEVQARGAAYIAECEKAAQAFAKLQAATRIHTLLAIDLKQGTLGNLMAPTKLDFFAPGITAHGWHNVETNPQIVDEVKATREAWIAAGLFVPTV